MLGPEVDDGQPPKLTSASNPARTQRAKVERTRKRISAGAAQCDAATHAYGIAAAGTMGEGLPKSPRYGQVLGGWARQRAASALQSAHGDPLGRGDARRGAVRD